MSNSPVVVFVVWFIVVAQLYFLTDAISVCRCLLSILFVVVAVVCGTRNFAAKLLVSVSAFSPLDGPRLTPTDRCHYDLHLSIRFSCRLPAKVGTANN